MRNLIAVLILIFPACAPIDLGIDPGQDRHDDIITLTYNPGSIDYEKVKAIAREKCGGRIQLTHMAPTGFYHAVFSDNHYANFRCLD